MVYNRTMNNEKILTAFNKQFNEFYYTPKDLEYGAVPGTFLSPFEYAQLLEYKENVASVDNPKVRLLPLVSFNSPGLYLSECRELSLMMGSYKLLQNVGFDLGDRFSKHFMESRIYSEVEGTLNIENVPTTRKRLSELLDDNAPALNRNDIIIKNMKEGIDFVHSLPAFTKANLFKLYSLLSKDCLDEENRLKPGDFYRYDSVEIAGYHGCPASRIDECMNSLFSYVNSVLNEKNPYDLLLLPHICHYYILYVHPYFDYNGRTARMVSYWIYLLSGLDYFPPIVSEAINQTKARYYQAIELSRDAHNDLTYFIIYLFNITIDYVLCYENISQMERECKSRGIILTETELSYIKRILICYEGAFTYTDFLTMAGISISKQGALKILNRFTDYGLLKEVATSSKYKLFDINSERIPYFTRNYGYRKP